MNLTEVLNPNSLFLNSNKIAQAREQYQTAEPFKHLVIDDFLSPDVAENIAHEFPSVDHVGWKRYLNPLENKYLTNSWDSFSPLIYKVFTALNSELFVNQLSKLTSVVELTPDGGLHGGGLHMHGRGGMLNVHLDYSMHPKLNRQRRLNLLVYLTPEWNEEWGGELGLWTGNDVEPFEVAKTIVPHFNRAVIFDTTTNSWHGLPKPIMCPESSYRRSIALYYLSEPDGTHDTNRKKAKFAPREEQKNDSSITNLIRMRSEIEHAKDTYEI